MLNNYMKSTLKEETCCVEVKKEMEKGGRLVL